MLKKLSISALCCLLFVAMASAKTQVVIRKDGRRLEGKVTEKEDSYSVETRWGTMVVPKKDVLRVEDVIDPADEYRQKLAKIDTTNPDQHYELADWAFKKGLLEQAKERLDNALELKSDHLRARLLLKQVEARIEREEQKRTVKTRVPKTGKEARVVGRGVDPKTLLSQEDINKVRLREVDRERPRVRVRFRNKVVQRFLEKIEKDGTDARSLRQFKTAAPARKLQIMLEQAGDDPSILDDIVVVNDPRRVRVFRQQIWPIVQSSCAASTCHGGAEGKGKFKLFTGKLTDDRIAYTNYAILVGYVGKGGQRMVDRAHHEDSLLLQYGLPKALAKFGHPSDISRPIFPSRNHQNYRRILSWISSLHKPDYPDYRLDYKPPFGMKLNLSGGSGVLSELKKERESEKSESDGEAPSKEGEDKDEDKKEEEKPSLFD